MAKLTEAARKKIPPSEFAGPNETYPVEDRRHAADAKSRASGAEHKGIISKEMENRIDAKADAVLGKSKK